MTTQTEIGNTLKLDPTPIMPGDTGQLTVRLDVAADLIGVEVEEGGTVERIIAGPHKLELGEGESWPEKLKDRKRVPGQAWIIVLVKNTTDQVKAMGGFLVVANEDRAPAGKKPVTYGEGPGSGGRRASYPEPPKVRPTATVVTRAKPAGPTVELGAPVTPGRNEVAVLLPFGAAQRLLQLVEGNVPLHDGEKTGIARALKQSLGR